MCIYRIIPAVLSNILNEMVAVAHIFEEVLGCAPLLHIVALDSSPM